MPVICRLLGFEADAATELARDPDALPARVAECPSHVEVSWHWHGIDYLLGQAEAPAAVHCLRAGGQVLPGPGELPPSRLHTPKQLQQIARDLLEVAPEALLSGYDPATMDAAQVYPGRWAERDTQGDILGDMLEHYSTMQQFAYQHAQLGHALLVLYEHHEDETGV